MGSINLCWAQPIKTRCRIPKLNHMLQLLFTYMWLHFESRLAVWAQISLWLSWSICVSWWKSCIFHIVHKLSLEIITLCSDVNSWNTIVGCWEFNLKLSPLAEHSERPIVIFWTIVECWIMILWWFQLDYYNKIFRPPPYGPGLGKVIP